MQEIFKNVLEAAKSAAVSIVDVAPVKATAAGALAFATGNHGTALLAFVILILIDLVTKWLSLSSKRLNEMSLEAGLWQSFLGLRAAFRDKYITSEMMKTKFAGKLILYMVLVAAAVHVDVMAGSEGIFLKAAWYYLAGTEFISIAENLRDAGVQSLDPLLNFVRSKLGGMK
ncbi:phage holin family protein [Sporomusa sphaeroides DSM 2875]|uniref:phage holin family protein n=1 Tax=Sporomusa sphaeroides TaxID=47679 RepID=UPI00202E23B4|nr:phage holin family protein [Sporomusa sphaeroides DSM 2875]